METRFLHALWIMCVLTLSCMAGEISGEDPSVDDDGLGQTSDALTAVRYPTSAAEFGRLYHNRGFGAAGNHLGRDILLREGVAVHPVARGTVRVYRSAQGYGTLVIVVEHRLPRQVEVVNGVGARVTVTAFLSIYGHMRKTSERMGGRMLTWHEGSVVDSGDVIGYVQHRDLNGDGDEHLHFGIRLQSMAEAARVDTNWFRGYDTTPSQRRWYADPGIFVPFLLALPDTVMDAGTDARSDRPIETVTRDNAAPVSSHVDAGRMDASARVEAATVPLDVGASRMDSSSSSISDAMVRMDAGLSFPDVLRSDARMDASIERVVPRVSEQCNGLDDDGNGQIDEVFLCPLGRVGPACVTSCGSIGFRRCEAPACAWSVICHPFGESCDNTIDDDCNGFTDCRDLVCVGSTACRAQGMDAGANDRPTMDTDVRDVSHMEDVAMGLEQVSIPDTSTQTVYEFRVQDPLWDETYGHQVRDEYWLPQSCLNTGSADMQAIRSTDGLTSYRCVLPDRLTVFTGRFRSRLPWHPGELATVYDVMPGRMPPTCTPTPGVTWRIYDRETGRDLLSRPFPLTVVRRGSCRHTL